jgi:hypothetical protein
MFLVCDLAQLAVQRLGEGREELRACQQWHKQQAHVPGTYLCLARVSLMAGDTNVVEQTVQLADDGGDLLGQVAGVHGVCSAASAMFQSTCKVSANGGVVDALSLWIGTVGKKRGWICARAADRRQWESRVWVQTREQQHGKSTTRGTRLGSDAKRQKSEYRIAVKQLLGRRAVDQSCKRPSGHSSLWPPLPPGLFSARGCEGQRPALSSARAEENGCLTVPATQSGVCARLRPAQGSCR